MSNTRLIDNVTPAHGIPDERVWRGVSLMLDQYLRISAEDRVLILYARSAREPAAWIAAELGAREIPTATTDLDTLSGTTVARFADKLNAMSSGPDESGARLVVVCVEYDIVTPSAWIRAALEPFAGRKTEVFRTIMTGEAFFRQGVTTSPDTLNNINAGLLRNLRSAERFTVRTSSGSELDITLDHGRYRWVSNRGMPREGAFVLLPAGEVATYPARISGQLVADGAFNSTAHTKLDARLQDHPAVFEIEDGRMVDYHCDNPLVEKLIERCLRLPNADRVGELGFGTNVGIEQFISLNSHLNERFPGLHIGFGQSNQIRGEVYSCDVHVDFIASDCTIEIAGQPPLNSADFKNLTGEHPAIEAGVFDEDLDGDCCGLFSPHINAQCDV
ncbi:hypothetical protein [Actinocrispum wychmicini]|uniref:Crocagin biosynthetic protein CgnE/B domain-containing protein n=1 Tax=Actinocrispum wychmicini TaxID=1213861 RepID=A0A4R2K3P1_9PSEU|nr:hypothetical protein [Actinocrispum wychmicini]TCO64426.1 hypothetical protein EV192_101198 [Actinocrispum wychmicini]